MVDRSFMDGVDSNECMLAFLGLKNDFAEMKQSWNSPPGARMPFLVPDGDKRTLIRVENLWWIGINMSTITRIPFLEAFCSDRWTKEIPTLTSVKPWVVRLVDFVFASGRDFVSTMLTTMPLHTFLVDPSEVIRDLDFLNIECKTENIENIDIEKICGKIRASSRNSLVSATKQESREAAETLFLGLSAGEIDFSELNNRNRNQVYESILFIASHPKVFGQNQRNIIKGLMEDIELTLKQEEKLEEWNEKFNFEPKGFDDEESDDSDDDCFGFERLGISRHYYGDADYYYDSDDY